MPTTDQWVRSQVFRFVLVGGSNTLITGGIVIALSFILPGAIAFSIAFALGIGYSLLLTGRWVFSSRVTHTRTLLFILAYLAIYLCGLGAVSLIESMNVPPWANGASIFITAPLSFFAGRFIFAGGSGQAVACSDRITEVSSMRGSNATGKQVN